MAGGPGPSLFAGIKAALDDLLQDAPVLAGMKFVHWYDKPIPQEDELLSFFGGGPIEEDEADPNEARALADTLVSGLTPSVIRAILSNSELPDTVASRALAYIRSGMADTDPDSKSQSIPDGLACQWLKVRLLRRERKKNQKETINEARKQFGGSCFWALYI